MKKILLGLLAFAIIFALTGISNALTLSNVDGAFSSPVGGSGFVYRTVTVGYGNTSQDQLRWGSPSDVDSKSGLGFTGVTTPSTFNIGDPFEIGQLQHFNNPIGAGSAPSSVQFGITLAFSNPTGLNRIFNFSLGVNETTNTGGACCDDIISFPNAFAPEFFTIDDIDYSLMLLGFGPTSGGIVSQFISPEGGTRSTLLWGEITALNDPVPEPISMLLFGTGLVGIGGYVRKKFKNN